MLRLGLILFIFIGTTLAGIAMVAALTVGQDAWQQLLLVAALGALAGVPVSWFVAKALYQA
ncbi:MAG TPA: CTP synthetase [Rhodobacteraceae bacterium]|nr:CTP synthetase [Paracoccaceae bacterium]